MTVRIIAIIIVVLVLAVAVFTVITPYPAVYFVRWLFKQYPYVPPANYGYYLENVTVQRNIDYGSAYPSGTLDIIKPKNFNGGEKVIFAVHGGAYISEGDKTEFYYVMLATEGFVTVNVRYAIAPEKAKYPVPVKQLEEAYTFIKNHNDLYQLNLNTVLFSGDSAGGQIVGQFVAMQTNHAYLESMNGISHVQFRQVVPLESFDGVVLLCAIYDFLQLEPPPENTMKLPLKKLALAYFNSANVHSKLIASAGILDKITAGFPRAFITDANTYSFEFEAKEMITVLEAKNIPVTSVFYDAAEVALHHNYQFHLNTPQGTQTYQKLIQFLNQ
ncbi:MAG: alpha/beta hydrolase [Spirochaetaceae bacterium]|jgi:acetyl esterase/lipase|nr:alpha/beta hydrolase [Spirochaetaceae bacterium]